MEPADRVERLIAAAAQYDREVSGHYDEVILEVAARAEAAGSIGKTDIGALSAWKRLRADTPYMASLMAMPDKVVRRHTGRALKAARDEEQAVAVAARAARAALSPLPGFKHGDALASALCFACAPSRMAIYDRRARKGLTRLGTELSDQSGRSSRYMALVEGLRHELQAAGYDWSARHVDLARYQLGRRP